MLLDLRWEPVRSRSKEFPVPRRLARTRLLIRGIERCCSSSTRAELDAAPALGARSPSDDARLAEQGRDRLFPWSVSFCDYLTYRDDLS